LTKKGETETHRLPLENFAAQIRGRKMEDATLERDKICYLGLILSLVSAPFPNPGR
jgi:hypothetical protein